MRRLLTMTASDLRQRIRDKSVVIFAVIVPLALITVFHFIFGGLTAQELEPIEVAVAAPADDPLAAAVPQVLGSLEGMGVTLREVPAQEVAGLVDSGEVDLGVVVPDGFAGSVMSGGGAELQVLEGDGAGLSGGIVLSVLQGLADRFTAGTQVTVAAATLGASPADLAGIGQQAGQAGPAIELVPGQASDEQLDAGAALVAGQAGMFLVFTVGFGVLALVSEREFGTLARLRSMPMPTWQITAAKALVSVVLGIVATTILLTAGSLLFDVDFGAPLPVAVLVLCAVLATTAVVFVIARVAKTAEQAGIAQSIVGVVLGMAGGAFFPLATSGVLGQVLAVNPVAAFTRGLGITSGGGGVADLGAPVLTLLVFAAVCLVIARLLPDRGTAL